MEEAFSKLKRQLSPYEDTLTILLKEDKTNIRESDKERFLGSLSFAKSGRMDRACEIWNDMLPSNPGSLSLRYNLGVCMELTGNLDEALKSYKTIDKSLTRPDDDVNAALDRVMKLIKAKGALGTKS